MLSLCLIVKNEVDVIERCINSVKDKMGQLVDDIVIVDTGSTDGTKELVQKLGCNLQNFEWCNDFAKARNYSISFAKNDWVLVLDADEFVVECNEKTLRQFLSDKNSNVVGEIDICNYGDLEGVSFINDVVPRVFNKNSVEYQGIIHETPKLKDGTIVKVVLLPVEIHHTGYIDSVAKKKNKAARNIELLNLALEKEEDMYLTMQLAKSYIRNGEYNEAIVQLEKIIFKEELVKYEYYVKSVSEYVRCLINLNQSAAGMICETFWDRCCEDSVYVYYMGHIYLRNKYYEKAVDCFLSILNKEDAEISKVMVLFSLGQLFAIVEMYEESLMYFEMCGDYGTAEDNAREIKKLMGK